MIKSTRQAWERGLISSTERVLIESQAQGRAADRARERYARFVRDLSPALLGIGVRYGKR